MPGVDRADHYVKADVIKLSKRMKRKVLNIKRNSIWFEAAAALNSELSPD